MKLKIFSVNDLFVVEPYQQGQGLKADIRNGFAFVQQKSELAGLKTLAEARMSDGSYIPAGSTVYIAEDLLTTAQWAKNVRKCSAFGDKQFIVVELKYITMIDTNEEV